MKAKHGIWLLCIVAIIVIAYFLYNNSASVKLSKALDLGQKYLNDLDYDEAIIAFNSAIAIDPNNFEAYIGLTDAYIGLGDMENATINLDKAYSLNSSGAGIFERYVTIAEYYYGDNSIEMAVESLEKTVEKDVTSYESEDSDKEWDRFIELILKIIDDYIENGDFDKAEELLEDLLEHIEDERLEEKLEEIRELIKQKQKEEQEEEDKKREQEKIEQAKKEEEDREQEDKDIRDWLLIISDLAKDDPVVPAASTSDEDTYYLLDGYANDYYEHIYTFHRNGNTWTVVEHEIYDGKVGETYPSSTSIGKSFDMTITEELREEYREYKVFRDQFQEISEKFCKQYFESEEINLNEPNTDYPQYFKLRHARYISQEGDDKLRGTIVLFPDQSNWNPVVAEIEVDTKLNQVTIKNIYRDGYGSLKSVLGTYDLD